MSRPQKNGNKRRFSDEQLRSLELVFESESRPESRGKQQLANDLGLQPHQVAVWFQNRRARLKNKRVESEYSILKANYEALASSFEDLQRKNQALVGQLEKLKNLCKDNHGSRHCSPDQTENRNHGRRFGKRRIQSEEEEKGRILAQGYVHKEDMAPSDPSTRNTKRNGEETDVLNLTACTDGSILHSLESYSLLDGSSCTSHWWEASTTSCVCHSDEFHESTFSSQWWDSLC